MPKGIIVFVIQGTQVVLLAPDCVYPPSNWSTASRASDPYTTEGPPPISTATPIASEISSREAPYDLV